MTAELRIGGVSTDRVQERFWAKVDKSGECWIWTASKNWEGYGAMGVNGRSVRAHRLSWEFENGPIPDGMVVDHACHVPSCVRPDHLRAVTTKQNAENLRGARVDNACGIRGVRWFEKNRKWQVRVTHRQVAYFGGYFTDIAEAEAAAIQLRNRLFTHNESDRGELTR